MDYGYSYQCNLCDKNYLLQHHYEAHVQSVHQSRVKPAAKQNLQHLRKPQQYQRYHVLGTYPIATNNPKQQSTSNALQHQQYTMNQQTERGSKYINHFGNLGNNNIINLPNSNTQHNMTQIINQTNSLIGTRKSPNTQLETNSSNPSNNQNLIVQSSVQIPKPQTNNLPNSNTQLNMAENIYQQNSLNSLRKSSNILSETNNSNPSNNQNLIKQRSMQIPKPQTNNLPNSNIELNMAQTIYQPNSLIGTEKSPNIRSETNNLNSSNNQELIPKAQTNICSNFIQSTANEINANPSFTSTKEPQSQDLEKLNSFRYRLKKFIINFAHYLSQEHRAQIATFILLLKQNEENDDVILEDFDNGYHFEYCFGYFTASNDGNRKCHCTNFFVRKKEILKIIDLYQQSCNRINTT